MDTTQIEMNNLSSQTGLLLNLDKPSSHASVTRFTSSPPAGTSNGDNAYSDKRISATKPKPLNCTLTRDNEASTKQSITRRDSNRTPDTPGKQYEIEMVDLSSPTKLTQPPSKASFLDRLSSNTSVTRFTTLLASIPNRNYGDQSQQRRISATKPKPLNCTLTDDHDNKVLKMQSITEKPIDTGRKDTRSAVSNFIKNNKILSATALILAVVGLALFIAAFPIFTPLLVGIGFILMFSGAALFTAPRIMYEAQERNREREELYV